MNWKNDIADAVLIVNYCLTVADERFYFEEHCDTRGTPTDFLRRIQTQLLEAYRQEINEPWSRFYAQKPVGGGNGAAAKSALKISPKAQQEKSMEEKYREHMEKYGNWRGKK